MGLHKQEVNMEFNRSARVILHILVELKVAHAHGVIHRDLK